MKFIKQQGRPNYRPEVLEAKKRNRSGGGSR